MREALLVVVWKHRMCGEHRVWPPTLEDYVGVVMLPGVDATELDLRLTAAIRSRFGAGEFTCLPDPPDLREPHAYWGSGGRSVRVA
jgi:hypothetical protein